MRLVGDPVGGAPTLPAPASVWHRRRLADGSAVLPDPWNTVVVDAVDVFRMIAVRPVGQLTAVRWYPPARFHLEYEAEVAPC